MSTYIINIDDGDDRETICNNEDVILTFVEEQDGEAGLTTVINVADPLQVRGMLTTTHLYCLEYLVVAQGLSPAEAEKIITLPDHTVRTSITFGGKDNE